MFLYSTFYEYTSIMSSHDVFCSVVFCIFLNGFDVQNKEGYDYEDHRSHLTESRLICIFLI